LKESVLGSIDFLEKIDLGADRHIVADLEGEAVTLAHREGATWRFVTGSQRVPTHLKSLCLWFKRPTARIAGTSA
jgi:hypothetical protein